MRFFPEWTTAAAASAPAEISFANSRPADDAFPMEQFRRRAKEVIDSPDAREFFNLDRRSAMLPFAAIFSNKPDTKGWQRTPTI